MFCTKCGKRIDDDAKFCVYCGAQITGNRVDGVSHIAQTEKKNIKRKSKNKAMIAIAAGIIALFAVIKLGVSLFKPRYEVVSEYGNLSIISNKGKYGVLNTSKKIIIPMEYYDILINDADSFDGYIIYMDGERSFTDEEGNLLYDELTRDDGMECYIAKKDGQFGVVSMNGVLTVPLEYKKITTEITDKGYIKATMDDTVYFLENTGDIMYLVTGSYNEDG